MVVRTPITSQAQWLALRERDVTASDVAALFGQHPYKTKLALYCQKRGELESGVEENDAMKRGRWAEAMFPLAMMEQHSLILEKDTHYYTDEELRLGCTPDFFAVGKGYDGRGLVEAKSCTADVFESWDGTPPLHYLLQLQTQYYFLPEIKWGGIAVMVMGKWGTLDLHWFEIAPRPKTIEMIRDAARRFWKDVSEDNYPAANYSKDGDTLRKLYATDDGEVKDFAFDNRMPELVEAHIRLKDEVKEREVEMDAIGNEIRDKMGDAAIGLLPGYKINFRSFEKKEYTVKASSQRPLKITKLKEEV